MLQPPLENVWLQFCFWPTERCSAPLCSLDATPCRRPPPLAWGSKASCLCQLVWPLSFARRSLGLSSAPSHSLSLSGPNSSPVFPPFYFALCFSLLLPLSLSPHSYFHVFVGLTNRVNAISWLYVFWSLPLASKTSNIWPSIMFKRYACSLYLHPLPAPTRSHTPMKRIQHLHKPLSPRAWGKRSPCPCTDS